MAMIHLLVGSTLGAAEYVAAHLEEKLQALGHQTRNHNPASLASLQAEAGDILLVVTATHGAGEIPDNLQPFATELAQQQPDLSQQRFAVVALGDSNYDTFCAAGHTLQQLLAQCRAVPLGEGCQIDVTQHDIPEDAADLWLEQWIKHLTN
ncbi:MAG: FMN-binding protein MioC [Aeromonadaceae bacterium]